MPPCVKVRKWLSLFLFYADSGLPVWSEHADLISKAYAGTGALKTDFTRTGKRTHQGALDDLKKSVLRYLRNNHFDGARQVSPDYFGLILRTYTLSRTHMIL